MAEIKSAIREVRDQLFLDRAVGKYLSHVSANIGFDRPLFGFGDDSLWRAVARRATMDFRAIENVFADLLTVIFGPKDTVVGVLAENAEVGDEEIFVQIPTSLPQRGTLVIDEGLATEEEVEYSFLDPRNGEVFLKTALTQNHTAPSNEATNYLFADAAAAAVSLVLEESYAFPTAGVLLIASGEDTEEVQELTNNTPATDTLTISPGLVNDQLGPRPSPIQSAVDSILGAPPEQSVIFLDDSSQFPDEGVILVQQSNATGTPTQLVQYQSNDKTSGMLVLKSPLTGTYTLPGVTATLMKDGAKVQLAQCQVKGIGWDIFATENGELRIFIPENLDRNRLLDASFLHDAKETNPSTALVLPASIGDLVISTGDAEAFPMAGRITIGGGSPETIGYSRINRFFTQLAKPALATALEIFVADVTPLLAAEEITKNLVLSKGGPAEEVVAWSSINAVTNVVTLAAALANTHNFAPATGSITPIAGALLVDGTDTFTIDDGLHTPVVFEFDNNSTVTPGNIPVPFTGGMTAAQVRDSIIEAINKLPRDILDVHAGENLVSPPDIDLQHGAYGTVGNVAITETVANVGFTVSGMSGGINGGGVEVADANEMHLNTPLVNNHIATDPVDLDEDEYAGTDLEIGDPTIAPANQARFQGPYLYDPGTERAIEQIETTLDENVAGPTDLVVAQRPGNTALEVIDAALFRTSGEFDVRVSKGIGVGETLDVTTVITRRAVLALGITVGVGSTDVNIVVSTTVGLPNAKGYRILLDRGGANEEIVWVVAIASGTAFTVDPPAVNTHVNGETVELLSDVIVLSEAMVYEHFGHIAYNNRLQLYPDALTDPDQVNLVEEIRTYIDVVDASQFTSTGGEYAQMNFGKRVPEAKSRLTAGEAPGSTLIDLEDTSMFPTTYPYWVEVGQGSSKLQPKSGSVTERVQVTNNNTTTNVLTTSALDYTHPIGDWVRYLPGDQEQIFFDDTDTAPDPNERLNFDQGVRFQNQHLAGEPIAQSNRLSRPSDRGFDYPFYLPTSWADRLKILFDKVRAAGVQVVIINDR